MSTRQAVKETLWHSEIRLPDGFHKPTQRVSLEWTSHALRAAQDDRYGTIPVRDTMTLEWYDVVEVATVGNRVTKLVMRGGMNKTDDIVIVIRPKRNGVWTVVTAWINRKTDAHKTLDHSKYMH